MNLTRAGFLKFLGLGALAAPVVVKEILSEPYYHDRWQGPTTTFKKETWSVYPENIPSGWGIEFPDDSGNWHVYHKTAEIHEVKAELADGNEWIALEDSKPIS